MTEKNSAAGLAGISAGQSSISMVGHEGVGLHYRGDLTEERIQDLKSLAAPIDGWGVGTSLSTCYDQPALDMVYKLGAIQKNNEWHYKLKRSDNRIKSSDPGILETKRYTQNKKWVKDIIYHIDSGVTESVLNCSEQDLMIPIFKNGQCVAKTITLTESRLFCIEQVAQFHASKGVKYSVERDLKLLSMKQKLMDNF